MRRVGIVGAGAMGSAFGGLLALAGVDVWLVDRRREQVAAIESTGLRLSHGDERRHARPHATMRAEEVGEVEVLLVWSKTYDTARAIADALPMVGERTAVVTLQNGLGNPEQIARHVASDQIVRGVTTLGGAMVAPGHVELTRKTWDGDGMTWIGGAGPAARVRDLFEHAGIRTELRSDVDAVVWSKLAMASPMSGVSGVTGMLVGEVLDAPEAMAVVERALDEIVTVGSAKGLALDHAEIVAHCLTTWRAVREHPPSLLQDLRAGRQTEIDALCGAVAREADGVGVEAPVNRTLASLVAALEQRSASCAGPAAAGAALAAPDGEPAAAGRNGFESLTIDRLQVGDVIEVTRAVTEADIQSFAAISGDHNPVHVDPEFARTSRFGRTIAHGPLALGLAGGIIGTRMPGLGTIALSASIAHRSPIYAGELVTTRVEVAAIDEEAHAVTLALTWSSADDRLIGEGETIVRPPREPVGVVDVS